MGEFPCYCNIGSKLGQCTPRITRLDNLNQVLMEGLRGLAKGQFFVLRLDDGSGRLLIFERSADSISNDA